eukprot:5842434-Lingulodinium_polyedra.AAC.1
MTSVRQSWQNQRAHDQPIGSTASAGQMRSDGAQASQEPASSFQIFVTPTSPASTVASRQKKLARSLKPNW